MLSLPLRRALASFALAASLVLAACDSSEDSDVNVTGTFVGEGGGVYVRLNLAEESGDVVGAANFEFLVGGEPRAEAGPVRGAHRHPALTLEVTEGAFTGTRFEGRVTEVSESVLYVTGRFRGGSFDGAEVRLDRTGF